MVFSDLLRNRRNDPEHRARSGIRASTSGGSMMRGFVADPADLLAAWRAIEDPGRQVVAPFQSHRRRLSTAHICQTAPGSSCERAA
jgi:hypothetical protein